MIVVVDNSTTGSRIVIVYAQGASHKQNPVLVPKRAAMLTMEVKMLYT